MESQLNFLHYQMIFFQKECNFYNKKLINVYYVNNLKQKTKNYLEYKLKIFEFFNKTENDFDSFFQSFTYSKNVKKGAALEFKRIRCQLKLKKKYLSGKFLIIACYFFSGFKLDFFRIRFYIMFLPKFRLNLNFTISMEIYRIKTIFSTCLYQKKNFLNKFNYEKVYNIAKFDNCTVFWKKKKFTINFIKKKIYWFFKRIWMFYTRI
ncbi:hypothetical protein CPARA_2gp251 (nucleomorph) [Cryptomonas paramecium]|uniref:Uncharacterized protein n=1 Tax=Cryptomonas paramaecium TaxID=2898 RepID=F2HHW3_9CRYP|nr:hypothetical protein CPARA_2gp251 [Cryptomonas paramecium]AEA38909.1 hypothetical protein CPARA_2gp251 [Cryptomonas paramecium]